MKRIDVKAWVRQLANEDVQTRTNVLFGLDAALFIAQTLLTLRIFAMNEAAGAITSLWSLGQAYAPFVVIVMLVFMMRYIEKLSAKLRQKLQTGFQGERLLTMILMGPNFVAMFLHAGVAAGMLPTWLVDISILGVIVIAGVALLLYLAVGDELGGG